MRLSQALPASDVPTAPQNTRAKFDSPAAAGIFEDGSPDSTIDVSGTKKSAIGIP
ncbi:hypothetical protein BGLT_01242 [Caballeronia glathei]|nr:hypothetical protein BGLT_01242 [Caballeronia glathei]